MWRTNEAPPVRSPSQTPESTPSGPFILSIDRKRSPGLAFLQEDQLPHLCPPTGQPRPALPGPRRLSSAPAQHRPSGNSRSAGWRRVRAPLCLWGPAHIGPLALGYSPDKPVSTPGNQRSSHQGGNPKAKLSEKGSPIHQLPNCLANQQVGRYSLNLFSLPSTRLGTTGEDMINT